MVLLHYNRLTVVGGELMMGKGGAPVKTARSQGPPVENEKRIEVALSYDGYSADAIQTATQVQQ